VVVNADGSRVETLSDFNVVGALTDRTTTTTSADRKTVTIQRDLDGNGSIPMMYRAMRRVFRSRRRARSLSRPVESRTPRRRVA
jgi:hypothetical protein